MPTKKATDGISFFRYFTEDALLAIYKANREALRLKSNYIKTEHLLLGIYYQTYGIGSAILYQSPVKDFFIKKAITKLQKTTDQLQPYARRPFDKYAKEALFNTFNKITKLNQNYIGTEHILLEILNMEKSNIYPIFNEINIDIIKLKKFASSVLQSSHDKTIAERNEIIFDFFGPENAHIYLNRLQYSFLKKKKKKIRKNKKKKKKNTYV